MHWYHFALIGAFLVGFILGALAQQWGAEEGLGESGHEATGGAWTEEEKSRALRKEG